MINAVSLLAAATVILHGWDTLQLSPEDVLRHADAFDAVGSDGVTLVVHVELPDGRKISSLSIMDDPAWTDAAVARYLPVFRGIVSRKPLEKSFLIMWWTPSSRFDWRDDVAWNRFVSSLAVAGRLSRQGGLAGVCVDGEDYARTRQFFRTEGDPPYDECVKLARQRGRECFAALFREHPNMTLFCLWAFSGTGAYRDCDDPAYLCARRGDLWPAFMNGMLDALPATVTFVDGDEVAGYDAEAENGDFWKNAVGLFNGALPLVAPENRAKYRAQLRVGSGLYMDSYTVKEGGILYKGPRNGSRLTRFAGNYAQAVRATDGFVWLYGEDCAWVPWKGTGNKRWDGRKTWDGALPGVNGCIRARANASDYVPGLEIRNAPVVQKRGRLIWTKVVSKTAGRFCGWPTVCRRAVADELLVAFSGDRNGHICPYGRIQMIRSNDGGESWGNAWFLPGSPLDDRTPGILALKDGTLVVTWLGSSAFSTASYSSKLPEYARHMGKLPAVDVAHGTGGWVLRSEDGCKSWKPMGRMQGHAPHGPVELSDGRLLQIGRRAADDGSISFRELPADETGEMLVEESADRGATWRIIHRFRPDKADGVVSCRDAHLVEASDGRIVALMRRDAATTCLVQSESCDGGRTWTGLKPTPILGGWPPHLIRLDNGRLLCSYARRGVGGLGEYACFSDDDGKTWDIANEIKLAGHFNDDLGYPSSVQLPDGSIVTVYYQSDRKGELPCVMATKWRPAK